MECLNEHIRDKIKRTPWHKDLDIHGRCKGNPFSLQQLVIALSISAMKRRLSEEVQIKRVHNRLPSLQRLHESKSQKHL